MIEKEDSVGGLCRSYEVNGYQVDTGPHILTRLRNGPLRRLMDQYFDVTPNFVPHGRYYVRLSNKVKPFPWSLQSWLSFDLLPLRDRIILMKSLFKAVYVTNNDGDLSRISVQEAVDGDDLGNPTLQFLECLSYFLAGAPMGKTPVARFLDSIDYKAGKGTLLREAYNLFVKEGAIDQAYPRGGIQTIVDSILTSFPRNRVEIRTEEEVQRIDVDDAVRGVITTEDSYDSNVVIYSGPASDLPNLIDGLPKGCTEKLRSTERNHTLTVWLGLRKKFFERQGSELWIDSNPYTWAVPTSVFDPTLAPKGNQLVGFGFSLPRRCDYNRQKKRALDTIFRIIPEMEKSVDMIHYQVFATEKRIANSDLEGVESPLEGLYLTGADIGKRSIGVSRASYSVLDLLSNMENTASTFLED